MHRLVRKLLITILVAVALCASALAGQDGRPDRAYVVTLAPSVSVDGVQTIAAQLAATYGGTLAKASPTTSEAFVLHMSAERARVLAADPRVTSVAAMRSPSVIANAVETVSWSGGVSYAYDGSGNISQIGNDKFVYDDVDRVVDATVNNVRRNYTYDAFGNRTACTQSDTQPAGDCQGFTINTAENKNRLTEAAYDPSGNGNVTGLLGHTYSYDAFNMMIRDGYGSQAREFVYTAGDERIATYIVSSSWRWTIRDVSGKVLRELTSRDGAAGVGTTSWQWAKDYVWRDGLLLASRQAEADNTTSTYHYHLDHLGTPRRITEQNDRIVGVHDYYAFGPEISGGTSEPSPTALQYTGHERDIWINGPFDALDYMHARYYSPTLGRFLSVDPAADPGRNMTNPQRWNRYTYATNSPLRFFDPTGLKDTIYIVNMLAGDETIGGNLRGTKQYIESHSKYTVVIVASVEGTPGQLQATLRIADGTDAVLAISHGGRDDLRQGVIGSSYLVKTYTPPGEHPKRAIFGDELAKKLRGSGGAGLAVFDGCQTAQFAQAYVNATGRSAVGTTYGIDLREEAKAGLAFVTQFALTGGNVTAGINAGNNAITRPECNSFGTDCGLSRFQPETAQPPQ